MQTAIKGILFDLGDTILDFGKVDIASLFEAGARLTYEYAARLRQPLPSFAKYHRRQLRAIRWSYLKSRITRREFNALDIMGKIARTMGHNLTHAEVLELAWLWYEPLSRCATVEPGVGDMLRRFAGQGMAIGLVSNTFVPGEVLDRHLAQHGLLDLLPVRVYSCDVGIRKPDPRIFEIALGRIGTAAPATVFVGDSPRADIAGANRCGMVSVLKDPAGRHANGRVRPAYSIKALAELPAIIDRHNGQGRSAEAAAPS
ncbi:MAG: HAD family hydrolase [Phycisphaerae bacterium]